MSDGKSPSPHENSIPLPLHLAPRTADGESLVVRRRPGRPRKVVAAPKIDADEQAYLDAVCRARADHIEADTVVGAVARKRADTILDEVIVALAREAAGLKWEREQAERQGRDAAMTSSRRIDALHKAALTILGRHRLGMATIDPRSQAMGKVIAFFVQYVEDALRTTLPAPRANELVGLVRERLEAWAATAEPM